MRWASIALFLALLAGCHSGKEPPRGAFAESPGASAPVAEAPRRGFVNTPLPPDMPWGATELELDGSTADEPKRDLGAELNAAIGSPVDCLRDFESESATTIRIPVSATVRPTGRVMEPSVSGVGLSINARDCVANRIATVNLAPLEGDASEKISTVLEAVYEPPVVIRSEAEAEADLRNVRDPLPKRVEVAPSGIPIDPPTSREIAGPKPRDPNGPQGKPVVGPKPRAIDGYQVDENAQRWD